MVVEYCQYCGRDRRVYLSSRGPHVGLYCELGHFLRWIRKRQAKSSEIDWR